MSDLKLQVREVGKGVTLIKTQGELDGHTFEQFENAIDKLFDEGVYRLVIDLAELRYISSAGAGVFISKVGKAQENYGNIILLDPSTNVKEVLDLLGLTQLFSVVSSQDAAVKAFAQ